MVTTPKKIGEIKQLTTNPKEENHTHIIPPPEIAGTNNHLSLTSLNINGLNSLI